MNDQYWKANGPVFLFIGGEGSLAVFDVLGGECCLYVSKSLVKLLGK